MLLLWFESLAQKYNFMLFFYYLVLSNVKHPSLQSKVTEGSGWVRNVVLEPNAERDMHACINDPIGMAMFGELKISLNLIQEIMTVLTL